MSENDNEKNPLDKPALLTSRARNRTVMLSSDMTGQMRSLIQSQGDGEDEENETESGKTNSGFLAPIQFGEPVASFVDEDVREKPKGNRNKTEVIPNPIVGSFGESRVDESGFINLNKDSNSNSSEKSIPVSVKEILKTSEFSKAKAGGSDTATLTHHTHVNFDADRSSLAKSRKVPAKSRILGFLISFDKDEHGEIIEIRQGRSIVSSKYMDQSEMIFIDDDSISNPHAVIKASNKGDILLLDQLSESGSAVIRAGLESEIDAVGTPVELRQGDIVRLGARYFIFCAVPKIAIRD